MKRKWPKKLIFCNTAIFGIGVIWFNFNKKVFTMVRSLLAVPFSDEECELAIRKTAPNFLTGLRPTDERSGKAKLCKY